MTVETPSDLPARASIEEFIDALEEKSGLRLPRDDRVLDLDSLAVLLILDALADDFDTDIPVEHVSALVTVSDLYHYYCLRMDQARRSDGRG